MVEYYSLSKCTGGLVTVLGSVAVQTTLPLRYVMQCHSLLMLKGHQMHTAICRAWCVPVNIQLMQVKRLGICVWVLMLLFALQ